MRADVSHCIALARSVFSQLVAAGVVALLNPLSCTVVFERPLEEAFVLKWQLACEGDIAHCILMPNHTEESARAFVGEYLASREAHGSAPATAIAGAGGAAAHRRPAFWIDVPSSQPGDAAPPWRPAAACALPAGGPPSSPRAKPRMLTRNG